MPQRRRSHRVTRDRRARYSYNPAAAAYSREPVRLVEFFDPRDIQPGVYIAFSSDPAYWPLRSLAVVGYGKILDESNVGPGVKAVMVEVTGASTRRKNPKEVGSVRIGRREFVGAMEDYSVWREAWWREVIQNAIDAGADEIQCGALEQPDRTWRVWCQDNGGGMTRETMRDKFLTLGESGEEKVGAETGSIGGFGQAKKLILFPWLTWKVHTRDTAFVGQGNGWEANDAPMLNGTLIEVIMPADQYTYEAPLIEFLQKSTLPGVSFTITTKDGTRAMQAVYRSGKVVHEVEGVVEFRHNKSVAASPKMLIRTRGMFMFSEYLSSDAKGWVTAELQKPSREVLTSNREGFRDSATRRAVSEYATRIAADVRSALKAKSKMIREVYHGTGKFRAEKREAEMLAQVGPVTAAEGFSTESIVELVELYKALKQQADETKTETRDMGSALPHPDVAREMLEAVDLKGATHIEAVFKQLAWEPDFFLMNNIEEYYVPKKFRPEAMPPKILKLAKVWTELVRFVFMQLGCSSPFGVGWYFDDSAAAAYVREEGQDWIVLNPFKNLVDRKEIWNSSDPQDLDWLYAAAIHECTHMADGVDYHNESFSSAFTRNVALCTPGHRKIRSIAAKTKAKGEVSLEKSVLEQEGKTGGKKAKSLGGWSSIPELFRYGDYAIAWFDIERQDLRSFDNGYARRDELQRRHAEEVRSMSSDRDAIVVVRTAQPTKDGGYPYRFAGTDEEARLRWEIVIGDPNHPEVRPSGTASRKTGWDAIPDKFERGSYVVAEFRIATGYVVDGGGYSEATKEGLKEEYGYWFRRYADDAHAIVVGKVGPGGRWKDNQGSLFDIVVGDINHPELV